MPLRLATDSRSLSASSTNHGERSRAYPSGAANSTRPPRPQYPTSSSFTTPTTPLDPSRTRTSLEENFLTDSDMFGGSPSSSSSSPLSDIGEEEKKYMRRYHDHSGESFSVLIDRGAHEPRLAYHDPNARARWSRRRLIRILPRPLTIIVVLAVISLLGVTLSFNGWWSDSALHDLPSSWLKVRPWTTPAFSASLSSANAGNSEFEMPARPVWIESQRELLKGDAVFLEAWVANGEVLDGLNFQNHTRLDGLWNWVNGSDPRHRMGRNYFSKDPTRAIIPPMTRNDWIAKRQDNHKLPFVKIDLEAARRKGISIRPSDADTSLQNLDARFREHDELRYSLRSAKASLGDWLRTSHVISTDFWPSGLPEETRDEPNPNNVAIDSHLISRDQSSTESDLIHIDVGQSDVFHVEGGLIRYGQLPQWVNVSSPEVRVGDRARTLEKGVPPALRMHHDWSCFAYLQDIDTSSQALPSIPTEESLLQRKLRVLPTFNSMAAEAALGINVTDLSEVFFYSNDDNFMDAPMTTADFATPLYGSVFHINRNYPIDPIEHPKKEMGEHPALRFSAWLLAERFGTRTRHYIIHVHKAHVLPLVRETRLMWGTEFAKTTAKRFRGDGRATHSHMLSYNFIMERHREALLWSYFVARIDIDGDGYLSDEELHAAWNDLDLLKEMEEEDVETPWERKLVTPVHVPIRDSLIKSNVVSNLESSKFPAPRQSVYQFSSQDGYALAPIAHPPNPGWQWPMFHQEPDTNAHDPSRVAAWIDWSFCWSRTVATNPIELFKRMAFVAPDCGDFLITLLVEKSGRKGLSAFLPSGDTLFPEVHSPVRRNDTVPHLPLNPRWEDADFSLRAVARNTGWSTQSRRSFAMILIQRYAYTVAASPVAFEMLTSPTSARTSFEKLRNARTVTGGTALIGINDDVKILPDKTFSVFHAWMEEFWPKESAGLPYENDIF